MNVTKFLLPHIQQMVDGGLPAAQDLMNELQAVESGFRSYKDQCNHCSTVVQTFTVRHRPVITTDLDRNIARVTFCDSFCEMSGVVHSTTFEITEADNHIRVDYIG